LKLRHIAALGLIGWYLMVPPTAAGNTLACGNGLLARAYQSIRAPDETTCAELGTIAEGKAPLSSWREIGLYDEPQDCQREALNLARTAVDNHSPQYSAKCVASDDPRLPR
jgi:hypothetical protein